jgi:hypothetical protein
MNYSPCSGRRDHDPFDLPFSHPRLLLLSTAQLLVHTLHLSDLCYSRYGIHSVRNKNHRYSMENAMNHVGLMDVEARWALSPNTNGPIHADNINLIW